MPGIGRHFAVCDPKHLLQQLPAKLQSVTRIFQQNNLKSLQACSEIRLK